MDMMNLVLLLSLALFVFFWGGLLLALGFGTRLSSLRPGKPRVKPYPNMRNCTFNDIWIDGKGMSKIWSR